MDWGLLSDKGLGGWVFSTLVVLIHYTLFPTVYMGAACLGLFLVLYIYIYIYDYQFLFI